jgi:hypothetical protein
MIFAISSSDHLSSRKKKELRLKIPPSPSPTTEILFRGPNIAIEYDPQPPFDSGAPSRVSPEFKKFALSIFANPNR